MSILTSTEYEATLVTDDMLAHKITAQTGCVPSNLFVCPSAARLHGVRMYVSLTPLVCRPTVLSTATGGCDRTTRYTSRPQAA